MTMPPPFPSCIVAIVLLGVLGLPIGHSMIAGSILYLLLSGLDLGTAAEQILNGLFNSYVLLAIPLFILAADLMNIGSLTDRLLQFCLVLVGRFRGGLGHVNVVANMIFAGMSGSAIADAVGIGRIIIGMMTRNGRYPVAYAGAITASAAIIGPIIPPSIPMVLYALISDRRLATYSSAASSPESCSASHSWPRTLSLRDDATIRSNRRSRCARFRASRCGHSLRLCYRSSCYSESTAA